MSTQKPSLCRVLSETLRMISAHSRHFLALSLLFLFPISSSTFVQHFLLQGTTVHSHYRRLLSYVSTSSPDSQTPPVGTTPVQPFDLLLSIFYLCAVSSITHSTFHAFYSRPVDFDSSLKSISASLFPLLATSILKRIMIFVYLLLPACVFLLFPYMAIVSAGFDMEYNGIYSLVYVALIVALLIGLWVYMNVELYLTNVIVVVESEWGVAPLRRSSWLVKGMRKMVFLTMLFFGTLSILLVIWYLRLEANLDRINEGRSPWLGLQVVVYIVLDIVLKLYGLAADTVLFVYCKALRGELELPVDDKSGGKYVQLSVDDVVNVG